MSSRLVMELDLDANGSARQDKKEFGRISFTHNDVALVEHQGPHDTFDQTAFVSRQTIEQVDLIQRKFGPGAGSNACEKLILAPLQRRVCIAKLTQCVPLFRLGERAGQAV